MKGIRVRNFGDKSQEAGDSSARDNFFMLTAPKCIVNYCRQMCSSCQDPPKYRTRINLNTKENYGIFRKSIMKTKCRLELFSKLH